MEEKKKIPVGLIVSGVALAAVLIWVLATPWDPKAPEMPRNTAVSTVTLGSSRTPTSLKYGELLDATAYENTLIIEAKIEPSLTDSMTVDQNYYNVCDVIRNQGGDKYDTISYWAVADMQSGDETKVISFDVDRKTIEAVASTDFADNTLGDYATDLWILPSLLD